VTAHKQHAAPMPQIPGSHLEIALEYARRGWLVLPLHRIIEGRCSCGRPSCTQLGKHPDTRHGVHDATRDERVVRAHWNRVPDAGIALAPGGARSHFVVLDLDVKDGGDEALRAFEHERGPLPETLIAKTGGGGRHFYFLCDDGQIRTRIKFRPGLDLLAQGGNFVVAPPSLHRSGNLYTWENWGTPLAPVPEAILLEARPPAKKTLSFSLGDHSMERRLLRCEAFMERVAPAIEGRGGWKATNGVCGIGGDFGLEPCEFWQILLVWNGRCDPPWDEHELWRKLKAIHERRDQPFGYRLDEERERDPITYVEHERPEAPPIGDEVPPPPPPEDRYAPPSQPAGPRTRHVSGAMPQGPELGEDEPPPPPPGDTDIPPELRGEAEAPAEAPPEDDASLPDLRVVEGKDEGGGGKGGKKPGRPTIIITTEEREVADQAIRALVRRPDLYARAGALSMIVSSETSRPVKRAKGSPVIVALPEPQVRSMMAESIIWKKYNKEGELVLTHAPPWVEKDVHTRGVWPGIRQLWAVAESPVLRPDGTVLDAPGYDDQTGIFYAPSAHFLPVPERPSQKDAVAAYAELVEVIRDFPLASSRHASAWIAGLLTPFARFAFEGPCPMVIIDGNVRGCGKTLLSDVIGEIVTGRSMARMNQSKDEEEERKRITSVTMEGDRLILIDNVAKVLGTSALDAALTGTYWSDRALGKNKMVRIPLLACWYATGNNVRVRGDTARRSLHVRLESELEHPEERSGFAHPDLLSYVKRERSRLVRAALTVLRAFCVAGGPKSPDSIPWGSFQPWSDLVREAIVFCGQPDPGLTRGELSDLAEEEASAMPILLRLWHELAAGPYGQTVLTKDGQQLAGCTIARVLELVSEPPPGLRETLAAIEETLQVIAPKLTPIVISRNLRRFTKRVFERRRLVPVRYRNSHVWCVEILNPTHDA
jgi:hypothetical protein